MTLVRTDHKKGRDVGYFNSYILGRIRHKKNMIMAITGSTGSGKSLAGLKEGETLDEDFDIRNVCFTPQEFMDLVNGKTKQLKRGAVILFDEFQASMSHLDWQSIIARLVNYVLQTFRHRGFILIVTTPHFSFINASARKLFHSRMETVSIDFNKNTCTLKPFLLQVNQTTGDTYQKYLRVCIKGQGVVPLKTLQVSLPSKELLEAYEQKKDNFTKQLNESISRDLDKLNDKGDKKKPLTEQQRVVVLKLLEKKNIPLIAKEMDMDIGSVYAHIELIKKKGIVIKPLKQGKEVLYYDVVGFEDN